MKWSGSTEGKEYVSTDDDEGGMVQWMWGRSGRSRLQVAMRETPVPRNGACLNCNMRCILANVS